MIVSDRWETRFRNWARVFGNSHRQGLSIAWACIQAAPEFDPDDKDKPAAQKPVPADIDDAAAVEVLVCSPFVTPMERRFIVGIWIERKTLGSFGYPKKTVVQLVRLACSRIDARENTYLQKA